MKEIFVESIKPGDVIKDVFVHQDKQLSHTKKGAPYLRLTLVDRTGNIAAVAWDNAVELNRALDISPHVIVQGRAAEYNGENQITISNIIAPSEAVDPRDFLPALDQELKTHHFNQLSEMREALTDPALVALLNAFFEDDDFMARFTTAPGGKRMHHAYLGGLLEHTSMMAALCWGVSTRYGANRDLLVTGAILHDIGKIHEYTYETVIDHSDQGRLVGHIGIGLAMLNQRIAEIGSIFPEDLAVQLRHMIISHHGTREWGSPEPPKTLEALILHHVDMLDAQTNALKSFAAESKTEAGWTPYHVAFQRYFLV